MKEPKQVIVVRKDLKMRTGKFGAQVAHATMKVFLDMAKVLNEKGEFPELGAPGDMWLGIPLTPVTREWLLNERFKKIICYVESEAELVSVHEQAKAAGLLTALIEDLGETEFHGVKTKTAVAVGPDVPEKIDAITGGLKLA